MIDQIDLSMVDWARAQFALTATYHSLFVPLTLGLAFIIHHGNPLCEIRES